MTRLVAARSKGPNVANHEVIWIRFPKGIASNGATRQGGRDLHVHPARSGTVEVGARTTNAIERLNGELRRRIKTQTVVPCAETVPMLLCALLASGQFQMRKVDGWETLSQPFDPITLDLAA